MQIHLQPAIPAQCTLQAAFSPTNNTVAVYSHLEAPLAPSKNPRAQPVFFVAYDVLKHERREFPVDTYTIWSSLEKIAFDSTPSNGLVELVTAEQIQYFNRICRLYRETIIKQLPLIQADESISASRKARRLEHHANLHGILALTEILYLPADGLGEGVVGEEILDWVNTVDRAPSAEEGTVLASLARPWEHPNFWPYLYRCVLRAHLLSTLALLSLVASHPSPFIARVATLALELLRAFPRSTSTEFRDERQFLDRVGRWRREARETERAVEGMWNGRDAEEDQVLGGAENEDARTEWEAGFRCLFELVSGREARLLEASEDWREALGAWGVWVNPGGRRTDLPETMAVILKTHSVDSTLVAEAVHAALILGDVTKALQQSSLLSPWLVAHLSDLLSKISVLPSPPPSITQNEDEEITLRNHFVLAYADTLLADGGFWRIVVDYLGSCGPVGRTRMRAVLRAVDLGAQGNGEEDSGKTVGDVLRVCVEYGLDDEMRGICKVYSEQLIAQKRYGEAVSFCVRARDGKRIARIAERVLDEYITNGQEAFIEHVDSIPTSLLRPSSADRLLGSSSSFDGMDADGDGDAGIDNQSPYPSISFLARYRDFFALYARGDRRAAAALLVLLLTSNVAPKGFYAVMFLDVIPLLETSPLLITLSETFDLLRLVEEITGPIVAADGVDIYANLRSLGCLLEGGKAEGGEKERTAKGLKQLEVVRGALGRHLGRCFAE